MTSGAVIAIAMTLNELCTNTTKFGALSVPAGRVEIGWTLDPKSQRLHLTWAERNGPAVRAPDKRSFGTRLIETLGRQLKGDVQVSAAPMAIQEAAPVMNQRLFAQAGRAPVQAGSASHSAHRIRRSSSPTLMKTKGASSWPVFEPTKIAGTPYASRTVAVFAIPALLSVKRPGCSPSPCRRRWALNAATAE
jgi:hypothetical protein